MEDGVPPTDDRVARPDTPSTTKGDGGNTARNGQRPARPSTTAGSKAAANGKNGGADRRKTGTTGGAADRRKSNTAKTAAERRTAERRRTAAAASAAAAAAPVALIEAPAAPPAEPAADIDTRPPIIDAPFVPAGDPTSNGNGHAAHGAVALPTIVPAEPETESESETSDDSKGTDAEPSALLLPPMPLPTIVPAEPETSGTTVVPTVLPEFPAEFRDMDGTDGLPSLLKPKKPPRALKTPVVRQHRRPRVRKVTRVVRHVDTWSVFKVAFVFSAFVFGVLLTAGVLLWQVAQNTGTVDNVERFFESFGWETFELKGGEIYHNAWIAGLFLMVGLTGLAVLAATMFNLITDLVGGIRVTVLEEEVVAREDRGIGWRRARRGVPLVEKLAPPLPLPTELPVDGAGTAGDPPKPVE